MRQSDRSRFSLRPPEIVSSFHDSLLLGLDGEMEENVHRAGLDTIWDSQSPNRAVSKLPSEFHNHKLAETSQGAKNSIAHSAEEELTNCLDRGLLAVENSLPSKYHGVFPFR